MPAAAGVKLKCQRVVVASGASSETLWPGTPHSPLELVASSAVSLAVPN
jgi:hypothetical protein